MTTINIQGILALKDNYIWLLIHPQKHQAIVIDPGESACVDDFLAQHDLQLSAIWITHDHDDHIGGVKALTKRHRCPLYAPNRRKFANVDTQLLHVITQDDILQAWTHHAHVWQTYGHTDDHVSFLLDMDKKWHVFCGDTLFNAGCGRILTGTVEQLFASFVAYHSLPEDALFYPAHEYTLNNLEFAKALLPNNQAILQALVYYQEKLACGKKTLPTSLSCQRKINPFMQIIAEADCHFDFSAFAGCDIDLSAFAKLSDLEKFAMIRKLKDDF